MIIETLSVFPGMFDSVMGASIMHRAQDKGIIDFRAYDLRDWTTDKHRTTDDEPFGGGPGLVMKCEPLFCAHEDIASREPEAGKPYTIFLSPLGKRFCDEDALRLSDKPRLLFVCGHYEGIDERAYALADETFSLGDYVLTSGELASMVVIDAVVRKLPGVLGAEDGADKESFSDGLLEYPQYTRPSDFRGQAVPEVLTSGNHAAIAKWRREQSLSRTALLRPDLIEEAAIAGRLTSADILFLKSMGH